MSALETVIEQHKNLSMSHLEYEDRALAELRNDEAAVENAAKDAVIEAARDVANAKNTAAWAIAANELRKRIAELDQVTK